MRAVTEPQRGVEQRDRDNTLGAANSLTRVAQPRAPLGSRAEGGLCYVFVLGLGRTALASDLRWKLPSPTPHHIRSLPVSADNLFLKIVRGEIPADILYQDELVTAFRDIHPKAPTHFLVVPNHLIATAADVSAEDEAALGRMITVAAKVAEAEGIADSGYRLIVNCKEHGGQEVYHLHMHVVGGHPLGRMLSR